MKTLKSFHFIPLQLCFNYVEESISQSKNKLSEDSRIVSLRNLILQCTSCLCNCNQVRLLLVVGQSECEQN